MLGRTAAELALFAGAGFLLFALSDLFVDIIYFARTSWRAMTVYTRYPRAFASELPDHPEPGFFAMFVPAWDDALDSYALQAPSKLARNVSEGSAAVRLPSIIALLASSLSIVPIAAGQAHPGGLNADGCHTNRKTGDYHCHRSGTLTKAAPHSLRALSQTTPFRNCSEARAAGATPVLSGDPRYAKKLDRDGDGIGCE